jgi:hypothetical protein
MAMQIVVCCAGGALSSPRLTSASLTPSVFDPRQKRTTHSASGDGTSSCMASRKLEYRSGSLPSMMRRWDMTSTASRIEGS